MSDSINDLTKLFDNIKICQNCNLNKTRIKPVLPEGNVQTRIMMIAQSPGKVENTTGRMFTGPTGKVFYELLVNTEVSKNDFYLTNLIKGMLLKSRDPSREQWDACTAWLIKEIELINPKVLVPLGFQATKFVLTYLSIPRPPGKNYRKLFGNFIKTEKYLILPLRHPTTLLFNPEKRDLMIENYKKLKELTIKYQIP